MINISIWLIVILTLIMLVNCYKIEDVLTLMHNCSLVDINSIGILSTGIILNMLPNVEWILVIKLLCLTILNSLSNTLITSKIACHEL